MRDFRYAVVTAPSITIYESPSETKSDGDSGLISNIADECLHGMLLRIKSEAENGFYPAETFYGYSGYVKAEGIRFMDEEQAVAWEESKLMVTFTFCLDVVSLPKSSGVRLTSLLRGSLVNVVAHESGTPGWARVQLADGRIGYLRSQYLIKKSFSQTWLWTGVLPQRDIIDECAFRIEVAWTANQYLKTQYRWGGKSSAGIDCSGLTSASYMLCGILIYRDAKLVPGYPVREIPQENMLGGDLIYFPGHIAMYLGNGKYIHSTGKTGSGGVVINSFNPSDRDYRPDLAESITAIGSIF